jgi:hypothetical protein
MSVAVDLAQEITLFYPWPGDASPFQLEGVIYLLFVLRVEEATSNPDYAGSLL